MSQRHEFLCQECGTPFETREQFEQHMAQAHPHQHEEKESVHCPICGATFDSPARFDLHKQHHHKPASKSSG